MRLTPTPWCSNVLPAGSELAALAGPELGYWQVTDGVMTGWVDAEFVQITVDYLQRGKKNRDKDRGNSGNDTAAPADAPSGGGIAWPVSGGTWSIMQGYNGSSHQNQDDLWQYYYSLDIVQEDGRTAGETVYSPVNGTVTWTDRSIGRHFHRYWRWSRRGHVPRRFRWTLRGGHAGQPG